MNNISLPQYELCKTNPARAYTKINCEYWKLNESCSPYCNKFEKSVRINDCKLCDQRISIAFNPVQNNSRTVPIVQELKNKLPQHNVYRREEVISEETKDSTFLEKAVSYSKAEGSQILSGKVSQEMYEARKKICLECPNKVNNKPEEEEIGWCTKCGCGSKNKRAALSNKLWMPGLECPLKKFGKAKGEGFNTGDALNSVKGIATSLTNLFKKEEKPD